jgi:hypothetical protein
MENNNLDINNNQCIQTTLGVGNYTHHNICDDTIHTVPWGAGDWIIYLTLFLCISSLVAVMLYAIKDLITGKI